MNKTMLYLLTLVYLPLVFATPLQHSENDNLVPFVENAITTRIIGGQRARVGQFPFAAAIRVESHDRSVFCGGALLSQTWIVTSGYCVNNAIEFTIILGSNTLTQSDSNRIVSASSHYILHPEFNSSTLGNDIALIKLRQKVQFTEYIDMINLPVNDYLGNVAVTAIGWGQTSDDEPGPVEHLNYVPLVTLTNEECKIHYGSQILDTMLCVGGQNKEGICTGDSGGPLVYLLNNRHPIVVGVASFHSLYGCEGTEPSGYTRIFPYDKWIKNVTENLNDN